MAELGFGLLASYLPILPRLYQRLANLNPYTRQSASAKALKDPETRAELSRAARKGLGPGGRQRNKVKGGRKGLGRVEIGSIWIIRRCQIYRRGRRSISSRRIVMRMRLIWLLRGKRDIGGMWRRGRSKYWVALRAGLVDSHRVVWWFNGQPIIASF